MDSRQSDIYIDYESWGAFEVFQMCTTQWRVGPMGQRLGLDYSAIVAVAQFSGYDHTILTDIRHLEMGAMFAYTGKDLESLLHG